LYYDQNQFLEYKLSLKASDKKNVINTIVVQSLTDFSAGENYISTVRVCFFFETFYIELCVFEIFIEVFCICFWGP